MEITLKEKNIIHMMAVISGNTTFFLEYAGELCIIALRIEEKSKITIQTHTHTHTTDPLITLDYMRACSYIRRPHLPKHC